MHDRPLDKSKETRQLQAVRSKNPPVGQVLRRARNHHQLSLREVERRIGRSNVYLSQVERGQIKQPNPVVLLELADLYGLDFTTLATWANWGSSNLISGETVNRDDTYRILVRQVMELNAEECTQVLGYVESILRKRRT